MLCIHNIHTRVCFNVFGSFGGLTERPRIVIESPFPTWKKNAGKQKQKATTAGPSSPLENCPCVSAFRVTFPLLYTFGTFPDRTLLLLLLVKYQGKRTVSFLSFLFYYFQTFFIVNISSDQVSI